MHSVPGDMELPRMIGERVRGERQARSWTLEQLAAASDVSRRMLINIEQGAANPSIGILLKISDALGVGLAALVDVPRQAALQVTPVGTGPVLWTSPAGGSAVLVASTSPPQIVELWDWRLGAGDRYAHDGHAAGTRELLHVLQGEVAVEVGEQRAVLETGDAVSFASDGPHAYANPNQDPARFSLSVFEPDIGVPTTKTRSRSPRA